MAGERLFTGQANPASTEPKAPGALGQIFTISTNGRFISGGSVWVEGGVFFELWQLWNKDTGTQLRSLDITSLSPASNVEGGGDTGWFRFNLTDLSSTPYGPSTGVNYIVNMWTASSGGSQVYTDGGFSYPFGTSPLSTTGSIYGVSNASTDPPTFTGFTTGRFYADVTLDSPASVAPVPLVAPSAAAIRAGSW